MNASPLPDVSFVVATHNRRDILQRLLDAIQQSKLGELDVEVIVVMDHCVDGTGEILADYASRPLQFGLRGIAMNDQRRGHAAASNVGFAAARAERILLADDDRIINDSYIRALADPIRPGLATVAKGIGDAPFAQDRDAFEAEHRPPDWGEFTCMGMARQDLFAVGGMDENLADRWGYADIDLGVRFWMYGCDFLYVPEASYVHLSNAPRDPAAMRRRETESRGNQRYLAQRFGFAFPPFHLRGLKFRYPNDTYFELYRQRFGFLESY